MVDPSRHGGDDGATAHEPSTASGLTRRRLLVAGGAVAWATPQLLTSVAHAQGTVPLTLFGVTGDGASTPSTLFEVSTVDAATSAVVAFDTSGTNEDGETIGSDGTLLYHLSGLSAATQVFESVDPAGPTVTPVALSGDTFTEALGLVWTGTSFRFGDRLGGWFDLTTSGAVTRLSVDGTVPIRAKGLALVGGTLYAVTPDNSSLHVLSLSSGGLSSTVGPITLAGFTVNRGLGLALESVTGVLYAVVQVSSPTDRRLIVLDPSDASATDVGSLGDNFAGIAFLS
jgi:hypothetical protein